MNKIDAARDDEAGLEESFFRLGPVGKAALAAWALSVPVLLLAAVVLQDLWGWFVVPLGVVEIGLAHALGIVFLAYFFLEKVPLKPADIKPERAMELAIGRAAATICKYLIAWGCGAVAHAFAAA